MLFSSILFFFQIASKAQGVDDISRSSYIFINICVESGLAKRGGGVKDAKSLIGGIPNW